MKKILLILLIALLPASVSFADQEAGNRKYVKSSDYGQFYVKSIPTDTYGLKGETLVFQVKAEQDLLLYTYDWYSPELFIYGYRAGPIIYIVKFGPWHRGYLASDKDLGIALYKNDQLLKEYSTLDIVGEEKNVSSSKSHYTIFKKKLGFKRPQGNKIVFDVEMHDGSVLSFNTDTGMLISKGETNEK